MKITPDNFAAAFQYMVGEPGPAEYHASLTEMHACRCDNCGTWWCDGEVLDNHDFSDEQLCIECFEGFSSVWCEGVSPSQHEAACRGLEMAQEAVKFRTLDQALAYSGWRDATKEFRDELLDAFRAVSAAKGYVATLRPLYRPCDVRPSELFTAAAVFEHFAKTDAELASRVSEVKHLIDAIVMLRPDALDRKPA
jgi:hypothetical protein